MPRIGLLFLEDLRIRGPWLGDSAGLLWQRRREREAGELLPPTAHPPSILVLVVRAGHIERLTESAAWLRLADGLLLVWDETGEPFADPETRTLIAQERWEAVQQLGNVVEEWTDAGRTLDRTIDEALAMADEVVDGGWTPFADPVPARVCTPGPWLDWVPAREPLQGVVRPDFFELELVASICRPGGRPAVLEGSSGSRIDLKTGQRTALSGLAADSPPYHHVAALPDGDRYLKAGWSFGGAGATEPREGGFGRPIGSDPFDRVLWGGGRCTYHWRVPTPEGPALWASSSHDWPCGHGKKLYGYKDNDPLWVHLAPDASACLSVYEHDGLLLPGLPVRWRDVGEVAVLERAQEPRALFFQRADGDDGFPGDPAAGDEDARDHRPTIVLGPSPELRYVIGFTEATWRLVGEEGVRLGGKGRRWTAYDADHNEVRSGRGRLLAGWHRWIVVLDDGQLWRMDLTAFERTLIGEPGADVLSAFAIPGTPNVLLLAIEDDRVRIRLV